MATVFVCLLKIQSQWFSDKMFATLSGFSILVGNIGGVAGQFPFALLALCIGWQNSYLLIALATIISGFTCFLLVRNKPQDVGLPSFNYQDNIHQKKLGLTEGVLIILHEKRTYGAICFYIFNQAAFLSFVGAWLVPWLREVHKMNSVTAANFGTLVIVGGMIGSTLSGMISDKLKLRKAVIITGSMICTCLWGVLAVWNTDNYILIGSLLFSLGISSSVFPLSMAIMKEVSPVSLTGTAIAIINTMGFLGIALGTSLLGFIADLGESLSQAARYNNVLITCFIISMASSFSSLFCYETHARNVTSK
jgi:sugar phosphate permease